MSTTIARLGARKFIGPEAIRGFLRRGDVRALIAASGLAELIDFIQGEQDASLVAKLPTYAICDLRTQTIIMPLSRRKVYSLLTRPPSHRHRTKTVEIHHHDSHHSGNH